MKLKNLVFTLCLLLTTSALFSQNQVQNVVFILADDLGWSDVSLYDKTDYYETPNLERLAARGVTFSRAYSSSPLCSPTRASIMTGQTNARNGHTAPQHHLDKVNLEAEVNGQASPGSKALGTSSINRLDTDLPTLSKLIKAEGYATAHFGKWHLGHEPYSPLEHGFDVDIPHWPGPGPAGSFVAPWKFPDFKAKYPGEHLEDRMADEAIQWLRSLDKDEPFYMNYWQFSVHAPFDAKESLIKYYRTKTDLTDLQHSPTYAAMVHSLDQAVGRLLDELDRLGLSDNTAIVFLSDNGGNMYDAITETLPSGEEFLTYPTNNRPLRGGKATVFEGGIRVPCIVSWPGITNPGSRNDALIQSTDFYTTILNLLDIPLPEDHEIDGLDITPALKGEDWERKEGMITYFPHQPKVPDWLPPSIAVHSGDWKLIRLFHQGEDQEHDYKLYNLKWDIGEITNLADEYPEKVKELDRMIQEHIDDANAVVPQPNPGFDPAQYHPEDIGNQPRVRWREKIELDK